MTPLERKITRLIARNGPIDVSQYMMISMNDSQYGYYKTANPFGHNGDFITAPEISQMFGEMIAIWAIATWMNLGNQKSLLLCEIGPGRGTLMDDVLRTIRKLKPEYFARIHVVLVETSHRLMMLQKEKLRFYNTKIQWVESFTELPDLPLVLIANELFDVLPIHQYVSNNGNLRERVISVDQNCNLCFSLRSMHANCIHVPILEDNTPNGLVIELSPIRLALARKISKHLAKNRGAALIIDYGALESGFGDTLQAISRHSFRSPLENPGSCDLTSHVDFCALASVAYNSGCHTATLTQGEFLINLGLIERAGMLSANKDNIFRQQIITDIKRLVSPDQMGDLFKAFCIADTATTMPPFSWTNHFLKVICT